MPGEGGEKLWEEEKEEDEGEKEKEEEEEERGQKLFLQEYRPYLHQASKGTDPLFA